MKLCRKCGETKPFEDFSKHRGNEDGLQSHCKACVKNYYQENIDRIKKQAAAYASAHPEVGRESAARWRKLHPELYRARIEAWRKQNTDRVKAAAKAWYEANKEKAKATNKAWWRANPEKSRIYYQNRRALTTGATSDLTQEEWNDIWAEFEGLCFYCGDIATAMDHIVPLNSRSLMLRGHHTKGNVVPACLHCNSSKGDRDPLLFVFRVRNQNLPL